MSSELSMVVEAKHEGDGADSFNFAGGVPVVGRGKAVLPR